MDIEKPSESDLLTKHFANSKFCILSFLPSISILMYTFHHISKGKKYQEDDTNCLFLVALILILITIVAWDLFYFTFSKLFPLNFSAKQKGNNFPFPEKLYTNPIIYFLIIFFTQKTVLKNNLDILFFFFFLCQYSTIKYYYVKVTHDFMVTVNSQTVINSEINTRTYKKFKNGIFLIFIVNALYTIFIYIIIKEFTLFDIFSFIGIGIYNTLKIIEIFINNKIYFSYLKHNINIKEKKLFRNLKVKFYLQMISSNYVLGTLSFFFVKSNMFYYHLKLLLLGMMIFQLLCIIYLFKNYQNTKKYYFSIEKGFPLVNKKKEECIICTEKLENARVLKCNHYFHLVCLTQWIEAGNYNCPLCRKEIEVDLGMLRFFQNFEENGFFQMIRGCIPNIL